VLTASAFKWRARGLLNAVVVLPTINSAEKVVISAPRLLSIRARRHIALPIALKN
jgi:hypothetical protein